MSRKVLLALLVTMALVLPLTGTQASPDGPEQDSAETAVPPMPLPPPDPADRSTWTPAPALTSDVETTDAGQTLALEPDCRGYAITINGTEGNDTITGTASADVIHGQAGNDAIHGGGGNDIICGGAGNDSLDGDAGDDTLDGGTGDDGLGGGDGSDFITGGEDNDGVSGGPGDDVIDGGPGREWLYYYSAPGPVTLSLAAGTATGEGNDTLNGIEDVMGSPFADALTGDSAGNRLAGGLGNDTLDGGGGSDEAGYYFATGVTADLSTGTATGEGNDTLISIENLWGSFNNYTDLLIGNAEHNGLYGGGGNDTLAGSDGDDHLEGHEGNDSLDGGPGTDYLDGGTETDTCRNGETLVSCEVLAVGGIAEYPQLGPEAASTTSGSSAPNAWPIAGLAAGGALILLAGAWYALRRSYRV